MRPLDTAVVTVSYRSAELTVESIRSIEAERAMPGLHIRVVVVDNASGDLPVLAEAVARNGWSSWVTLVEAPRNGGFGYGNNLGIQRACETATPDYIYLLNPDARTKPGALAALVRFLEEHADVGIAGSKVENLDDRAWPVAFRFPGLLSELEQGLAIGAVSRLLRPWVVARHMADRAEAVDWVSGASMLIRPSVLATAGGMDENYFLYFEETDFCFRARTAGFSTWYVPDSHVVHLKGQSTGVSAARGRPQRLPGYWFESRRRYFVRTYGVGYAVAIDAVALLAHSAGLLKRMILGRTRTAVPAFVRDILRHSVLWPRNRAVAPPRCPPFTGLSAGPQCAPTTPAAHRIASFES